MSTTLGTPRHAGVDGIKDKDATVRPVAPKEVIAVVYSCNPQNIRLTLSQDLQFFLQTVVEKLKKEPTSITADDARRIAEHFSATDERMARLISAIEANAAAHDDIAEVTHDLPELAKSGHVSLHTIATDLLAAVERVPHDVTEEILRKTQAAVSKMQQVLGHTNRAPHPELEPELQSQFNKIKPKIEQGTVTREEADRLHSTESRAHGHTEKGGLTAQAQSIAARRERQASLSDASNSQPSAPRGLSPQEQSHRDREANLRKVEFVLRPKIENDPDHVTKEDASLLVSRERRAHGTVESGSLAAEAQSLADKHDNLEHAKEAVVGKDAQQVTKGDAAQLQSREARAHGVVKQGSMAAQVQSEADKNQMQAEGQNAIAI